MFLANYADGIHFIVLAVYPSPRNRGNKIVAVNVLIDSLILKNDKLFQLNLYVVVGLSG
jgi:hypothetical protein